MESSSEVFTNLEVFCLELESDFFPLCFRDTGGKKYVCNLKDGRKKINYLEIKEVLVVVVGKKSVGCGGFCGLRNDE